MSIFSDQFVLLLKLNFGRINGRIVDVTENTLLCRRRRCFKFFSNERTNKIDFSPRFCARRGTNLSFPLTFTHTCFLAFDFILYLSCRFSFIRLSNRCRLPPSLDTLLKFEIQFFRWLEHLIQFLGLFIFSTNWNLCDSNWNPIPFLAHCPICPEH